MVDIQNLRSIQLLLISNVLCNNDFAALWLSRIFRWQLESRCIASFGLLHSARNLKVSKSCSHKYNVTIHAIKKDSDLEYNVKICVITETNTYFILRLGWRYPYARKYACYIKLKSQNFYENLETFEGCNSRFCRQLRTDEFFFGIWKPSNFAHIS